MNLVYVEQVNRLTETIIGVRSEIDRRQKSPPHPRTGTWRHQLNIEKLRFRAEYLEKKRMALLAIAPRVTKEL